MARKKVVYIVSDIEKSLSFEWTVSGLADTVDLFFILIGKKNTTFSRFLADKKIPFVEVSDQDHPSMLSKWMKIFLILRKQKTGIVHVHLWRAMLLGLTAAWLLRIRKRIFTRHHAMIHYDEFPSGRKWDMLCNTLATNIVAISENVREVIINRDKGDADKITIIHHGVDFPYFENVEPERINAVEKKHSITGEPVIGVIARYLKLKGIQYIIPAFKNILKDYPKAKLVLANTVGNYKLEIEKALEQLPSEHYREILFEDDLNALYKTFDVFLHVPIDRHSEAFGQTYVEALASGVPAVFTLSGVAPEFIKHEYNALIVPYQDADAIEKAIRRLLKEKTLRDQLVENGRKSVRQFSVDNMIANLVKLYE